MTNTFNTPVQPSPLLEAITGPGPLTRGDVAKRVWDYIKANSLQDPKDKRMINADDKLRPIFGERDQVSMFEMTALVSRHMSTVASVKVDTEGEVS